MLLDLSKIRTAARALRADVTSRGRSRRRRGLSRRRRRSRWRSTSTRTRTQFRLRRARADDAGAALQPVPRAVRRAGRRARSTCGTCRTPERRGEGGAGDRRGRSDDGVLRERRRSTSAQLMREQFYLALPMKPLCARGVPGLCPTCGDEPESRPRATASRDWEDPRLAALEGAAEPRRRRTRTMPNPKRRHSKTRTAKRRTHDALKAGAGRASARSATSRRRRTASARTAATTAAARCGRSRKSSRATCDGAVLDVTVRTGDRATACALPSTRWAATTRRGQHRRRRAGGGAAPAIWRCSLVGDRGAIERGARAAPGAPASSIVAIVDAPDVVGMEESPAAALRRKPRASIRVAAEAVARGEAAALFSAGHTGATVMAAHGAFGMLPGVDRPALAATIPTRRRPAVLLDVGRDASSAGRSTCCSSR